MNYKKFFSISLLCTALSTFCMAPNADGQKWIPMASVDNIVEHFESNTLVALKKARWERGSDAYLYRRDPSNPIYYVFIGKFNDVIGITNMTYCMKADYSTPNEPLVPSANPYGSEFIARVLTNEEMIHLAEAQAAGKIIFNIPANALQVAE